jgi:hypothetical protein
VTNQHSSRERGNTVGDVNPSRLGLGSDAGLFARLETYPAAT